MDVDGDVGVHVPQPFGGRVHLGPAQVALAVEDLTVEVADVHRVRVHDAQRAHAGRGQVEPQR